MGSRVVARGVLDRREATTGNVQTLDENPRFHASLLRVGVDYILFNAVILIVTYSKKYRRTSIYAVWYEYPLSRVKIHEYTW